MSRVVLDHRDQLPQHVRGTQLMIGILETVVGRPRIMSQDTGGIRQYTGGIQADVMTHGRQG
jgi:hypothetical protein